MQGSRLTRVKSKKNTQQAVLYLVLAIIIVVAMITWGVPAAARFAGLMISSDTGGATEELKPTPPVLSDIPEATNEGSVSITGFAQPGVEVVLYVNGTENKKILSDESGVFAFEGVAVDEGDNRVYAYAVSARGTESDQSKEYMIVVDKKAPELTISSPENGHVYRGSTERIAEFEGLVSEEGSRVTIGERVAIVQTDGSFRLSYQMIEGDQEIEVKAVDAAANETVRTIKIRWEP